MPGTENIPLCVEDENINDKECQQGRRPHLHPREVVIPAGRILRDCRETGEGASPQKLQGTCHQRHELRGTTNKRTIGDSRWVSNPEKAKSRTKAGAMKPASTTQKQKEKESGAFYKLSNIILITTLQGGCYWAQGDK